MSLQKRRQSSERSRRDDGRADSGLRLGATSRAGYRMVARQGLRAIVLNIDLAEDNVIDVTPERA